MIYTARGDKWEKIYSLKKKPGLTKRSAMLLNHSGTKNARETRFVPESSLHVPASEFRSFRAASGLLDNENDK